MSNELATTQPKQSALAVMASRYSVEPLKLLDTLKNTVFKNANEAQLMALVIVSNEYGLNPFTKQIFAFPDKSGGIVPVVSVDGWIKLMNDQPRFDGIEFEDKDDKDGKPFSCTAVIHIKERSRPVKVTEYYSECYRNTEPWNKMPRRMLRNRTLNQGVRIAFGLSGIYDEDEAENIKIVSGTVIERPIIEPSRVVSAPALEDTKKTEPATKPTRSKLATEKLPPAKVQAHADTNGVPPKGEPVQEPAQDPEPQPEPTAEPEQETAQEESLPADATPHDKLKAFVKARGFTPEATLTALKQFFPRQAEFMTALDTVPEKCIKLALDDLDEFSEGIKAVS